MKPAVTVLQLDTHFPRVPGDVGCPDTYRDPVEIIRIPLAKVAQIVSNRPDLVDIAPFEDALGMAHGDIVVTSCGFLSYWQDHLAALTAKPFISSALIALKDLKNSHEASEVLTVTFDAKHLTTTHFGDNASFARTLIGLSDIMHLRDVIANDRPDLDGALAGREIAALVRAALQDSHRHLLLECTNLPPYKAAIRAETDLPITDILTCIEAARPGTIQPQFLI